MSEDALLTHRCPHLTIEERTFLGIDRRTLLTRQPIASGNSVLVSVNDELFIPPSGLFSQAELTGTTSGPFRTTRNETALQVTSKTHQVSIDLPVSSRLAANDVVLLINRQAEDTRILADNHNGHLRFTEAGSVGGESLLKVSGRAGPTLGFGDIAGARGRRTYPGWQVNRDLRDDAVEGDRLVVFDSILKQNPIIKVTYTTRAEKCLRCRATLIENDFRYDQQGELILIKDENLLYQAALKILLTDRGSSPFHPWYGTEIKKRIGQKAIGAVAALITEDVRRALDNFKSIQTQQSQAQTVSYKETLYQVIYVQVLPHANDPTTFLVEVAVQNASQDPVELSIVFTVPDVIALQSPQGPTINALTAGLSLERLQRLFPVSGS
jgi:phage baseplate assembly protein W